MSASTLLLSLLLAAHVPGQADPKPSFTIEKTFSDRQIRQIERQVARSYNKPVKITVLNRNEKNEITNLVFVRYGKDGRENGSCSSDKFGRLLIREDGCSIADVGHEGKITVK